MLELGSLLTDGSALELGSVSWLASADGSVVADDDGSELALGSLDGSVLVSADGGLDGVSAGVSEPSEPGSPTWVTVVPWPPEMA